MSSKRQKENRQLSFRLNDCEPNAQTTSTPKAFPKAPILMMTSAKTSKTAFQERVIQNLIKHRVMVSE
jgi:hypothetical protein